jgi:tRNA threonylcarbamoyladenosine biosynthesis protein TsaE
VHQSIVVSTLADLDGAARQLLTEAGNQRVWLFFGEMGAGKTTFIKAICRALGVTSVVQSPTFGLVNEYTTETGESVYHFDCYRLRNEAEAFDIGIDEYLDSGAYCFVEWPEKIPSFWPDHALHVSLTVGENQERIISW